jgi:hypothetical protein
MENQMGFKCVIGIKQKQNMRAYSVVDSSLK